MKVLFWFVSCAASVAFAGALPSPTPYTLPEVPAGGFYVVEGSKSKHEVLRAALNARGWREGKNGPYSSYGFKWTWSENRLRAPSEQCVVNHFANYTHFSSKRGLLQSLRASSISEYMDAFVPRTYFSREEMPLFLEDFRSTVAHCNSSSTGSPQPTIDCSGSGNDPGDNGGSLWIAKPAAGTRGVGIQVFSDAQSLSNFVGLEEDFVVQKYIERPLLIFGRKFDIRQFVLVTSLDPLIVFASTQCYLRFSSLPYSGNSLSNVVHLTNHQVQKHMPENQDDHAKEIHHNQWSLDSFRKHIGNDVWTAVIKPRINSLIAKTVSAWPNTTRAHRKNSFELLGFDILLDRDLNPWLLEVNSDPGLHLLTEVVNPHHKTAVDDLLRVVLDERAAWQGAPTQTCLLEQHASCAESMLTPLVGVWQMILKR